MYPIAERENEQKARVRRYIALCRIIMDAVVEISQAPVSTRREH